MLAETHDSEACTKKRQTDRGQLGSDCPCTLEGQNLFFWEKTRCRACLTGFCRVQPEQTWSDTSQSSRVEGLLPAMATTVLESALPPAASLCCTTIGDVAGTSGSACSPLQLRSGALLPLTEQRQKL